MKNFFYDIKDLFLEERVLIAGILKWTLLSGILGALVGVASSLFLKTLESSITLTKGLNLFLLIPIAFLLNALFIKFFFPDEKNYTTNNVIKSIHKFRRIGLISGIKAFIAPIITIAGGGSLGKEAPAADIGATLGSMVAGIFRLTPEDKRKLVICGISAGFASVFGAPIAGAIFGIEVLFIGSLLYEVLLPSFIAGITAYSVSSMLGTPYLYQPMSLVPKITELMILKIVIAGVFFGICSFLIIEIINSTRRIIRSYKTYFWVPPLIGGIILAFLSYFFSEIYLGLGMNTIEASLQGVHMAWYVSPMKIVFTVITLAAEGIGGLVTPLMFIGATAGNAISSLIGIDAATMAAIGLTAVMAGALNTPISASILSIELFGPQIGPYAALACIISFIVTGYRSVYPGQILKISKLHARTTRIGKYIEGKKKNVFDKIGLSRR